ncbi:hypothetical protein [Amycolatopsis benzoatilytica]|uniref:hypothetical protein n=1 Tax=Amycolatopsis benzoatilytica TaxID=346045 RepID=UPI00037F687C|nr:hypothetical protein [Amycolatopsis benzoatilytica]
MRTEGRLAGGFGFPLGCAATVAAAIAADLAGAAAHPGYSAAAVAVVVAAVAVITTPLAAAGVAVVGWAVLSGFDYGRSGDLLFDASTGWVALVLAGALVLGLVSGAVWRAVRQLGPAAPPAAVPLPRRPAEPGHRRVASP